MKYFDPATSSSQIFEQFPCEDSHPISQKAISEQQERTSIVATNSPEPSSLVNQYKCNPETTANQELGNYFGTNPTTNQPTPTSFNILGSSALPTLGDFSTPEYTLLQAPIAQQTDLGNQAQSINPILDNEIGSFLGAKENELLQETASTLSTLTEKPAALISQEINQPNNFFNSNSSFEPAAPLSVPLPISPIPESQFTSSSSLEKTEQEFLTSSKQDTLDTAVQTTIQTSSHIEATLQSSVGQPTAVVPDPAHFEQNHTSLASFFSPSNSSTFDLTPPSLLPSTEEIKLPPPSIEKPNVELPTVTNKFDTADIIHSQSHHPPSQTVHNPLETNQAVNPFRRSGPPAPASTDQNIFQSFDQLPKPLENQPLTTGLQPQLESHPSETTKLIDHQAPTTSVSSLFTPTQPSTIPFDLFSNKANNGSNSSSTPDWFNQLSQASNDSSNKNRRQSSILSQIQSIVDNKSSSRKSSVSFFDDDKTDEKNTSDIKIQNFFNNPPLLNDSQTQAKNFNIDNTNFTNKRLVNFTAVTGSAVDPSETLSASSNIVEPATSIQSEQSEYAESAVDSSNRIETSTLVNNNPVSALKYVLLI